LLTQLEEGLDPALRGAIPSLIERLGDENPGIRISAVSIVQSLATYSKTLPHAMWPLLMRIEGRFAPAMTDVLPSLVQLIEDGCPSIRKSAAFILDKLGYHTELADDVDGMDENTTTSINWKARAER
jgi:HEAT repeat protein